MPPKHSKEVVKSKSIPQDEITKKIEALQCEALTLTYKRELDVAIEVLDKIVSFLGTIQSSCSTLSQKNIDLYNEAFDEFYCALSQYSTDKNDLAFYEKLVAMLQASVSLTKNVDHIKNYSTRSEELLSLCKEIPDQNAAKAKKLENAYKHYTEAHLKLLKSFYDSSDIAQQGNFSSSTQKYLTSLVTEDLKSDSIFESLSALLELIHSHKDASCKEEMYIALIERLRDPSLGDKVKPLLSEVYANFGTYNLKLDKVKSEILYKNALIENPSNHSAHLRLGMSCYKRREFEKALEHYEAADSAFQAIHHKHNYLYVWNAMRTTLNTNDYQKSVDLLQTCSKLDPAESTETNTSPKHFQENKGNYPGGCISDAFVLQRVNKYSAKSE